MIGKLIIITAPSGAGKTSITRYLLNKFPELAFSVSAATREARGAEKDGVDYYFISANEFRKKIENNEFAEWEMVYEGKYYGTLKSELARIWAEGRIPILDIDVKGAIHIQQQFLHHSLSVFVLPPSLEALKTRLHARGTESHENIATRLNKASYELSFSHSFDKVVINGNLKEACAKAEAVIKEFIDL